MLGKREVIEWSRCRPSERRRFFGVARKDIARTKWSSDLLCDKRPRNDSTWSTQTEKRFFRAKVDDRNRENSFLAILHN